MSSNIPHKKTISKSEKSKKLKDFKLYDIDKASYALQKIMTKYQKKKLHLEKQPKTIAAFIEKARFKAERLETDKEYMMKELKNEIKLEQELVALFGSRAKKHYNELDNRKFTSKINKYDFFTPKEIKNIKQLKKNNINKTENESKPILTKIVFKRRKTNFSLTIMAKNKAQFFNTYSKDLKSNNTSKNSTKLKRFYRTSSKLKKFKNFKPYQTFDEKDERMKISENRKENRNQSLNNKLYLNTEIKHFSGKDNNCPILTLSSKITKSDFYLDKAKYLDELININKEFLKKENKLKNHFKNNDYGCEFSKMEYRYLTKKFFN